MRSQVIKKIIFFQKIIMNILTLGCYEYLLKCRSDNNIDVSRLFIYYNGRIKDQSKNGQFVIIDKGSSATGCIQALVEHGVCLEEIWPFEEGSKDTMPHDLAYKGAENSKVTGALAIKVDLNEMKTCLAQGYPFVFGLMLFTSFDRAVKNGHVPMPKSDEPVRGEHGGFGFI